MKRLIAGLLALVCSLPLVAASWSWTTTDPLVVRYRVQVDGTNGDWIYLKDGVHAYASNGSVLVLQYSHDGESYSDSLVFTSKPGTYQAGSVSMVVEESQSASREPTGFCLSFVGGPERTITSGDYALYDERGRWEIGLEAAWKEMWRNAGLILGGSYIPAKLDDDVVNTFTTSAMMGLTFPSGQYEISLGLGGFCWFWGDSGSDDLTRQMYGLQGMLRYTFNVNRHWFAGFDVMMRYYLKSRFYHKEAGQIVSDAPENRDGGAMTFGAHAVVGYRF